MPTGGGTGGGGGGSKLGREDREQIQLRDEGRAFPGNTGRTPAGRNTYNQMRREGFDHENAASGARAIDANPHEYPGGPNGSPVEALSEPKMVRTGYFDAAGRQRPWPQTGLSFKNTFLHGGRGGY